MSAEAGRKKKEWSQTAVIEENKEQALHMKEQEAELEGLTSLETFDKDKLLTVIDSVQVYSEERIEIVWKMNDGFFSEVAGEKELVTLQ